MVAFARSVDIVASRISGGPPASSDELGSNAQGATLSHERTTWRSVHQTLRLRKADGQSAVLPAPAGNRVAPGEAGAFHDVS